MNKLGFNNLLNRLSGLFREKEKYAVLRIEDGKGIFMDLPPVLSKKEAEHHASAMHWNFVDPSFNTFNERRQAVSAKEFNRLRAEGMITETEADQLIEKTWLEEENDSKL